MIGSNPVHLTPAFPQEVQAGRFWSQRFFRTLQRLHAETLRKEDAAGFELDREDGVSEDTREAIAGGVVSI